MSSHHKSFRCVENDLCLGRGMMRFKRSKLNAWNSFCWKKRQDSKDNEYQELTDDKKDEILLEYSKHKKTQTTGIQISTKSKIKDVTLTLKAVKNEGSLTQFTSQQSEELHWG
ncbi:hypothetical protein BDR03DRAFT_985299 [Suillus americanus]|nr:hypothetical protein BDR03DRAFT_985299 [Suillus americanus]